MTENAETNSNDPNAMDGQIAPNSSSNRFTKQEKQVLFQLFLENEDIIDIKQRKSCPKKHISIRDCWNKITDEFNCHPNIKTARSLKQIQKFWLNARLRKSYPGNSGGGTISSVDGSNENLRRSSTTESNCSVNIKPNGYQVSSKLINSPVNPPKLIRITAQNQRARQSPQYGNIKFEKDCETEEIEMVAAEEEEDLTQEVEISTSSNDANLIENESQQYSIDHISADKLTLNDLLEFKNGRSRDEIVLQIRTSEPLSGGGSVLTNQSRDVNSAQSSYATSYRIAHPISQPAILQDQPIQQTSTSNQSQHINISNHHPLTQKIVQSPQNSMNSTNYYTTNNPNNNFRAYENVEDKLTYYQLKEAELKYKEGQLKIEKMKIEVQKAKDELKNIRELHAYRIKEMEVKLKILQEEEKRLSLSK